jgi:hypothetical protein
VVNTVLIFLFLTLPRSALTMKQVNDLTHCALQNLMRNGSIKTTYFAFSDYHKMVGVLTLQELRRERTVLVFLFSVFIYLIFVIPESVWVCVTP